jgi:hypothetical protein
MCIPHPISFPLFLLKCSLNFLQTSNDPKKTNTKSSRPDHPEDRCPFKLSLYFHLIHKRWCIAKESHGSSCHHGHIPLALDEVHLSTTKLSEEVLRPGVVEHCLEGQQSALRTLTNCYESPDASNFYTNDDNEKAMESDDHEAPEDRGNSKVPEPFRVLAPFLDGVCRLIEDESDILCAKKGMNIIMKELLERKKNKIQTGSGTTSLVSFPEMDKRNKDYRKRPTGSPRK